MWSYSTTFEDLAPDTSLPQQQLQRCTAGWGSGTASFHARVDRATSFFIGVRSFVDRIYVRVGWA